MPDAPIGFVDSTPPDMFTGSSPSSAVAPFSVIFQPSPSGTKPRFSSHIGSYQLNGTYISMQSICSRGLVMPAWPNTSRSEEHTSELQSLRHLVCRLLLEKKK